MLQGFPKKHARFSKMKKNMSDLLSDETEGKIIKISTLNIQAIIGRLLWETLYITTQKGCYHTPCPAIGSAFDNS